MNFMSQREEKLEQQRLKTGRVELVRRMTRAKPSDGLLEVFPGLVLGRFSRPTERVYSVFKPSFCVIAQGSKEVLLGGEVFRYDPSRYLIATVDLPVVTRVVEASDEESYLGFQLHLDAAVVASVVMESGVEIKKATRA